jgi:hypothetical protein
VGKPTPSYMATKKLVRCKDGGLHIWKWHHAAMDIPYYSRRWCTKCKKKYQALEIVPVKVTRS